MLHLTAIPLIFWSTRSNANWPRISLSVRCYKESLYSVFVFFFFLFFFWGLQLNFSLVYKETLSIASSRGLTTSIEAIRGNSSSHGGGQVGRQHHHLPLIYCDVSPAYHNNKLCPAIHKVWFCGDMMRTPFKAGQCRWFAWSAPVREE